MTILMMFYSINVAYAAVGRNPWVGHSRGGWGASGRPEIPDEKGPHRATNNKQEAKKSPTQQQLYRASWRTESNRTKCTAGREHGAPGDSRVVTGDCLGGAHNRPEKQLSAKAPETLNSPDSARRIRARNGRLIIKKMMRCTPKNLTQLQ